MKKIVLKFGGSSLADNKKLNIVASKIIDYKKNNDNVVVIVSAQGKTTNKLIDESLELSKVPNDRDMDMLLSSGEQISASKLSILLNSRGHSAVALTGWQAGIETSAIHQNAKIENIHINRIERELKEGKIVIITGFQGIDKNGDITTLGRGGSDTSAIAIASAINADKCYILSDVDGIYSADPKKIPTAKKLKEISYEEMQEITDAGAKVLHNRCIKIGNEFDTNIIAASTFDNNKGTKIVKKIENSGVKSIVKNTNLIRYILQKPGFFDRNETYRIYHEIISNNIPLERYRSYDDIEFYIPKENRNKLEKLLETKFKEFKYIDSKKTKLSIIGSGITNDSRFIDIVTKLLNESKINIINIEVSQSKIEIIADDIDDIIVQKLHDTLIK